MIRFAGAMLTSFLFNHMGLHFIPKTALLCGCVVCLIACQSPSRSDKAVAFHVETVKCFSEQQGNLQDIVRETEIIALENSPESAFANIDRIVYGDNRFYILDKYGANKLLIFDDRGNFVRSIGRRGRGPGEYLQLESFTLKGDTLFLLDTNGQKILTYDTDGNLLTEANLQEDFPEQMVWLSNGFLFYKALYQDEPSDHVASILRTDRRVNTLESFFSYDESAPRVSYEPTLTESDSVILFSRYLNDTVIAFDRQGSVTTGVHFDFGDHAIPADLSPEAKKAAAKQSSYGFLSSAVVPVGRYLCGTLSEEGKRKVFAWDRNSGRLYVDPEGETIPALPSNISAKDSTAIVSWVNYGLLDKFVPSLGKERVEQMRSELDNGTTYLLLYHLR